MTTARNRVIRIFGPSRGKQDLINVFPETKIFTISESSLPAARHALAAAKFEAAITDGLAKVSVVGMGMRGVPGVMAKVVNILNSTGVEILQTADSHATISCLVRASDTQKALCACNKGFNLGNDSGIKRRYQTVTKLGTVITAMVNCLPIR